MWNFIHIYASSCLHKINFANLIRKNKYLRHWLLNLPKNYLLLNGNNPDMSIRK